MTGPPGESGSASAATPFNAKSLGFGVGAVADKLTRADEDLVWPIGSVENDPVSTSAEMSLGAGASSIPAAALPRGSSR